MPASRIAPLCFALAVACAPSLAAADATNTMFSNLANPAIGMNALFSGRAAHNLDEPYGLHFDEAEVSLISVVDPYWMLASNIVFAPDGVDPEEIWVRNTSIPGIGLKLGKIRGSFGKHGLLHPHAFPFIQAPIVMANTIGEEGFKDPGLEAAWLTPLPWFAEITGGVYEGGVAPDGEHPLDFGSRRHDNIPFLGHLKNQVNLNDETTLELGGSFLQGRGADGNRHLAFGADATIRNVPAKNSNRRGWIVQSEYIQKGRGGGSYTRESDGGYASFQYRLSQVWWAGIRGERARRSFTDFMVDDSGFPVPGAVTRGSANVQWGPSEFSYLRLEYSHAKADAGIHPTDDRIMVQMSYTIGYHPAHPY